MKVFVILLVWIGISLFSGMYDAEARVGTSLYITLEEDTIKQNSFINTDGEIPIITIQKEQTVSFPLKVISGISEPTPINFVYSIEHAIPDTRTATLPDMKIEFEPFNMLLKPDQSQMLNVTVTTLNYTQLGERTIIVTAQDPHEIPLLNTGFDVLVIDVDKNPCFNKTLNQPKPCSPETSLEFYKFMGAEWMKSKKQEMLNAYKDDMFHEWIDQTENHYHWNVYQYYSYTEDLTKFLLHPNPHKQYEIGVEDHKIKCNNNLVLLQKYNGIPACVTESTKQKLIERGWTDEKSWTASYGDSYVPTVIIPLGSSSISTQKNFEPQTIKVVLGVNNTVHWINQDDVPSSVNSDHGYDGYGFTSPHLKPGDSWAHTFTKAGIYDYHSIPHPWKNGKVIVLEGNLAERLQMAQEILGQHFRKLPIVSIGAGNADRVLDVTIHEDELEKFQDAVSHYKNIVEQIIPFDVPIRINFGEYKQPE